VGATADERPTARTAPWAGFRPFECPEDLLHRRFVGIDLASLDAIEGLNSNTGRLRQRFLSESCGLSASDELASQKHPPILDRRRQPFGIY
jgi:hypothetical protein